MFEKCEFFEKRVLKMWILWKMRLWKCESYQKSYFRNMNFWKYWGFFTPVCSLSKSLYKASFTSLPQKPITDREASQSAKLRKKSLALETYPLISWRVGFPCVTGLLVKFFSGLAKPSAVVVLPHLQTLWDSFCRCRSFLSAVVQSAAEHTEWNHRSALLRLSQKCSARQGAQRSARHLHALRITNFGKVAWV